MARDSAWQPITAIVATVTDAVWGYLDGLRPRHALSAERWRGSSGVERDLPSPAPAGRVPGPADCPASGWGLSAACCEPDGRSVRCSVCARLVPARRRRGYGEVRFVGRHRR